MQAKGDYYAVNMYRYEPKLELVFWRSEHLPGSKEEQDDIFIFLHLHPMIKIVLIHKVSAMMFFRNMGNS